MLNTELENFNFQIPLLVKDFMIHIFGSRYHDMIKQLNCRQRMDSALKLDANSDLYCFLRYANQN